MTKKPRRGRPRSADDRQQRTFRFAKDTLETLEAFRDELDPQLSIQYVAELMIRHCGREKEAGNLRPLDLFGKNGG